MSDDRINTIRGGIKGMQIGSGFRDVPIDAAQAAKLAQAKIGVGISVAGAADQAAVVRVATSPDVIAVHVQFPLTAPLPANVSVETLAKILALATFLPESGLTIDPKERLAWNFYKEFAAGQTAESTAYLQSVLALRARMRPEFFAELAKLGLSTSLADEGDLHQPGAPVKLTPAQLAAATQGGFLRSLVVGLALGAGSAVIAGATGGVGVVVGVIGEAAYGAALS